MAETTSAPQGGAPADDRLRGIDWEAIERSPEFQQLVKRRRSFLLPATIFYLSYYMAFILFCGYAEDFMASSVYEGLTVGYCLALTQFVMVLVLGLMYLKRANSIYDPLAEKAIEGYAQHSGRYAATDGHGNGDTAVGSRAATSDPEVTR